MFAGDGVVKRPVVRYTGGRIQTASVYMYRAYSIYIYTYINILVDLNIILVRHDIRWSVVSELWSELWLSLHIYILNLN